MRRFGAPFRICLPVWAVLAPWAPTRRGAELRTILLIACAGLVMSITGCLPASAATRHIVLLFDERVELPGLSVLEAEFVHTLRFDTTEPVEVYREPMDLSRFNSNFTRHICETSSVQNMRTRRSTSQSPSWHRPLIS